MASLVKVYNVCFDDHMKLVLADFNHLRNLIRDDTELFEKLLLNEIQIIPKLVAKDSKIYKTPFHNNNICNSVSKK